MSKSQFSAVSYRIRGGFKYKGQRFCKREKFVTKDEFVIGIVSVPLRGYRYKVSHPSLPSGTMRGSAQKRVTINYDLCCILSQLRESFSS